MSNKATTPTRTALTVSEQLQQSTKKVIFVTFTTNVNVSLVQNRVTRFSSVPWQQLDQQLRQQALSWSPTLPSRGTGWGSAKLAEVRALDLLSFAMTRLLAPLGFVGRVLALTESEHRQQATSRSTKVVFVLAIPLQDVPPNKTYQEVKQSMTDLLARYTVKPNNTSPNSFRVAAKNVLTNGDGGLRFVFDKTGWNHGQLELLFPAPTIASLPVTEETSPALKQSGAIRYGLVLASIDIESSPGEWLSVTQWMTNQLDSNRRVAWNLGKSLRPMMTNLMQTLNESNEPHMFRVIDARPVLLEGVIRLIVQLDVNATLGSVEQQLTFLFQNMGRYDVSYNQSLLSLKLALKQFTVQTTKDVYRALIGTVSSSSSLFDPLARHLLTLGDLLRFMQSTEWKELWIRAGLSENQWLEAMPHLQQMQINSTVPMLTKQQAAETIRWLPTLIEWIRQMKQAVVGGSLMDRLQQCQAMWTLEVDCIQMFQLEQTIQVLGNLDYVLTRELLSLMLRSCNECPTETMDSFLDRLQLPSE